MQVRSLESEPLKFVSGGQKNDAHEKMSFITHVHILFNMTLYILLKVKLNLFALGLEKNITFNGICK